MKHFSNTAGFIRRNYFEKIQQNRFGIVVPGEYFRMYALWQAEPFSTLILIIFQVGRMRRNGIWNATVTRIIKFQGYFLIKLEIKYVLIAITSS